MNAEEYPDTTSNHIDISHQDTGTSNRIDTISSIMSIESDELSVSRNYFDSTLILTFPEQVVSSNYEENIDVNVNTAAAKISDHTATVSHQDDAAPSDAVAGATYSVTLSICYS